MKNNYFLSSNIKLRNALVIISIVGILIFLVSISIFGFYKWSIVSNKQDCSKLIPENPYPKSAQESIREFSGFEWSKIDRGSRDCEAWNESFISGCMEYVKQENAYNQCLGKDIEVVKPVLMDCEESDMIDGYCLSKWSQNK